MLLTILALSSVLAPGIGVSAGTTLEPKATCPLTEANVYRYGCAQKGWVQTPSYLKILKDVTTLQSCAKSCHAASACKSFRFAKSNKRCYLYNKYLDAMAFDTDNFQDGIIYERECFTTNCNLIDTCDAVDSCSNEFGYNYFYMYYTDFGCGYGVTARLKNFEPQESLLQNGLSTCDAASACADKAPYGPFIISFQLTSNRWICSLYNSVGKDYEPNPTLHQQHINHMTLTYKNSSIGASYGYWLYNEYYPDGS